MSDPAANPTPQEAVQVEGPWQRRFVAANGARFHCVGMGKGPLVLFLHGFPTYWWTWRHQLPAVAQAGYRAVAMDLRGYGGSDHTPHGYDPFTLAGDVSAVIRSLGHRDAVVVGHGWGGLIAWSAAVLEPAQIRAIAPISMPHPARLREAFLHDKRQRRLSGYAIRFQMPLRPEKRLLADDAAAVAGFLRSWSGDTSWLTPQTEVMFRRAFQYRATAHCALEYHRWAVRSIPRPDGIRYTHRMEAMTRVPVLQIHGESDGSVLPSSADGSETFVEADYRRWNIPGIGHFPHEESPQDFSTQLVTWLAEVSPTP